jgi:hypothetical protein
MAEDIAERLEAITVDIESVKEPKRATGLDAARTTPLPPTDIERVRTGSASYSATLKMSGQEMALSSTREISLRDTEDGKVVDIISSSQGPMGSATDHYVVDAGSMLPLKREVQQGPATVEVAYSSDSVTGSIKAGQEIPISVELDAQARDLVEDRAVGGLVDAERLLAQQMLACAQHVDVDLLVQVVGHGDVDGVDVVTADQLGGVVGPARHAVAPRVVARLGAVATHRGGQGRAGDLLEGRTRLDLGHVAAADDAKADDVTRFGRSGSAHPIILRNAR